MSLYLQRDRITRASHKHSYIHVPWWLSGKESAANAGILDSIPGLESSPGEGNGNPPNILCLENPMDRVDPDGKQSSTGSQRVGHD